VRKYDVPAENVTTGSLEALQAYSLGYQAMNVKADYKGAAPLFERAASLDPNFAMAYGRLAYDYRNSNDYVRAAENARKAYDLRQRVSEREKFYIEAAYELIVTENLEAARKIYELWAQIYPRDDVPQTDLGLIYYYLGDHEKRLTLTKESLRLDPGSAISTENLIGAYISLNRLDEAKATIQEAQAHNLDLPLFHLPLFKIAFLEHDAAGMDERQIPWWASQNSKPQSCTTNRRRRRTADGFLGLTSWRGAWLRHISGPAEKKWRLPMRLKRGYVRPWQAICLWRSIRPRTRSA
jgi:tetratricopeptide (TPR) repeat protein